ncbi:MAG: hypothetical protein JXQ27_07690 [Acidobacteria bacterium]|nr:hypothetical protein [Acidobacteriota bacterium]
MNECRKVQAHIRKMAAGQEPSALPEAMRQHMRQCGGCRELWELHARLAEGDMAAEFPTAEEFAGMRRAVRQRIQARPRLAVRASFWQDLDLLLRAHPAVGAIMAVILLAGVFWLGRATMPGAGVSGGEEWLLQDLQQHSGRIHDIRDMWDSPYVYSNVSFRPVEGGGLEVGFDVTRHVSLKVGRDSSLMKGILVHALLDSSTMGHRLEAMDMTDVAADARIRQAVIYTLHHDPELAVRLKALEVVARGGPGPDVQAALLGTLRQDTSVQMRLRALEHLAAMETDGQAIREAIFSAGQASDPALWVRARELRVN